MDRISERYLVLIISLIQYITIFEFVIINPLAPDYILDLGILSSNVGMISGSYSLAAAVVGIIVVTVIDNQDRKNVLLLCLFGMLFGSILSIISTNFTVFILATIIKGMFSGPATTIALAIISDAIAPDKRGRAVSTVMTAFPIVAAFGVPLSLEISQAFDNWRVALGLNLICICLAIVMVKMKLPQFRGHLADVEPMKLIHRYGNILNKRHYILALLLSFISYFAGFLIIPNLPNYFIFNLGYPRENLGLLYFVGGVASFFVMRIVGFLLDMSKSRYIIITVISFMVANIYFQFINQYMVLPTLLFFVVFMICMSSRNIVISTLITKIPSSYDRASFLSLYNVSINLGVGISGFISSSILSEGASFELVNIEYVAMSSILVTITIPFLIFEIEKVVKKWNDKNSDLPILL